MTDTLLSDVFVLALATTTAVKTLVDIVRLGFDVPPKWMSPVLALCSGPIFAVLISLALGQVLTSQSSAQCILAGILGAGGAVGVTELSRKAT